MWKNANTEEKTKTFRKPNFVQSVLNMIKLHKQL